MKGAFPSSIKPSYQNLTTELPGQIRYKKALARRVVVLRQERLVGDLTNEKLAQTYF